MKNFVGVGSFGGENSCVVGCFVVETGAWELFF